MNIAARKMLSSKLRGLLLGIGLLAIPVSSALADACAGVARCFDAGVFAAEVTSLSLTWNPTHKQHFIRLNLRFRNTGTEPIILGFPWRNAATLTDNYSNAYTIDTRFMAQNVSGLGVVSDREANASFVIPPGGSRTASLMFNRWVGKTAIGNVFTADFPVKSLTVVHGQQQVRVKEEFSLNFPELTGGVLGSANNLGESIGTVLDAFKKK